MSKSYRHMSVHQFNHRSPDYMAKSLWHIPFHATQFCFMIRRINFTQYAFQLITTTHTGSFTWHTPVLYPPTHIGDRWCSPTPTGSGFSYPLTSTDTHRGRVLLTFNVHGHTPETVLLTFNVHWHTPRTVLLTFNVHRHTHQGRLS